MFEHVQIPKNGSQIQFDDAGKLLVPNNPIIPFIQGDGIGLDITPVMQNVVNNCLLYTSTSPRDGLLSRMPSSA